MASTSPVASPRRVALHAEASLPDLEVAESGAHAHLRVVQPPRISRATPGASLAFDAVTLAIPLPRRGCRGEPPSERFLLRDVSGVVPPGQMFALMGSRCGQPARRAGDACAGRGRYKRIAPNSAQPRPG